MQWDIFGTFETMQDRWLNNMNHLYLINWTSLKMRTSHISWSIASVCDTDRLESVRVIDRSRVPEPVKHACQEIQPWLSMETRRKLSTGKVLYQPKLRKFRKTEVYWQKSQCALKDSCARKLNFIFECTFNKLNSKTLLVVWLLLQEIVPFAAKNEAFMGYLLRELHSTVTYH